MKRLLRAFDLERANILCLVWLALAIVETIATDHSTRDLVAIFAALVASSVWAAADWVLTRTAHENRRTMAAVLRVIKDELEETKR